ncbi:MAG: carbohydrate kinase family protein [Candidatus Levybacteria bacterium]|nr:carbohydrate kinase family protein [Candidatus Levybacteria bacterium]
MPQNFDMVCVGNATVDAFLTLKEAKKYLRFLPETNELCIKFGEKITVDKVDLLVGGNAANVSVGLSRMSLKVGLMAELGNDEFAQKIINTLKKENVSTSFLKQTKGQNSSFSTIINFQGERTIFSEHVKRDHDFNFNSIQTKWIYLTSLGEEWKNTYDKTYEFVEKTNCQLAFNPGTLQINGDFKDIQKQMSIADILFLNKEEAEKVLSNKYRVSSIKEALRALQKLGPKIVVITDGKNGSYALEENGNFFQQGIIEAKIVEKTGAGDAYSSGFLSAILHNKSVKEAMLYGARNATSVISKVGAQTGLLYEQ